MTTVVYLGAGLVAAGAAAAALTTRRPTTRAPELALEAA
jgi:hypothetical protein